MNKRFIYFLLAIILSGCDGSGAGEDDGGVQDGTVQDSSHADAGDGDTDADTDTDTDSDGDSDSDAGEDACMYDPEDRIGWVRTWGGEKLEEGDAVAVGPDGTILVAGIFQGEVDFDPGPGQDIHTSTSSYETGYSGYVSAFTSEGIWQWTSTINGSGVVDATAVEVMQDGSIVVGGSFTETVDFDPGSGNHDIDAEDGYYSYVLKLTGEGEFKWVYIIKGEEIITLYDLTVSNEDNVILTGDYDTTIIFESDGGMEEHTAKGGDDSYIAKLGPEGELLWSRSMGGGGMDEAWGVASGPDECVVVIGEFERGTMDFDPGPGVDEHTADINDVYLIKLDSDGNYEWGRHIQGPGIEFGRAVEVDDDGNIYAAVEHSNQVDFDPDTAGFEVKCSDFHCFSIAKYNAIGSFLWADTINCSGPILDVERLISTTDGIVAVGNYEEVIDFDPSPGLDEHSAIGDGRWDMYLAKYYEDGSYAWATTIGHPAICNSLSASSDISGSFYITGYFKNSVDFDPSGCTEIHESTNGSDDTFLLFLNETGGYYDGNAR